MVGCQKLNAPFIIRILDYLVLRISLPPAQNRHKKYKYPHGKMNKIYYQQVAKCTDDGKLEINDKETLEAYVNDLFNAPPAISKMEEMLRLGTACLKEGNESVALDIFRAAYHLLYPLECGKEQKLEYAHTIYSSLCTLNGSGNEYIWESTGEYVTACRDFINGLRPGTLK